METTTTQANQEHSIETFKVQMFIWEFVITGIIFGAAFFALRAFKRKEQVAREKNKKYNTGISK